MSVLDIFKKKSRSTDNDYDVFSKWLNHLLTDEITDIVKLPNGVIAYNFNIYEGSDLTYDIQLIGANEYSEEDDDWACTDYYTSGENICYIKRTEQIKDWKDGQSYIRSLIVTYLKEGKCREVLKKAKMIGIGFVDGDIERIVDGEYKDEN